MSFLKKIKSEVNEKHLGDYIIRMHPVAINKIAENGSIGSVSGRIKLMAKLVISEDQDKDRIGANLCYKKTAEWLLSHRNEWDTLNIVILALNPNLAVHVLITNQDNSAIMYDLDNAPKCKKPEKLDGYFIPMNQLNFWMP